MYSKYKNYFHSYVIQLLVTHSFNRRTYIIGSPGGGGGGGEQGGPFELSNRKNVLTDYLQFRPSNFSFCHVLLFSFIKTNCFEIRFIFDNPPPP